MMKKIFRTALLSVSILMLSGCGVVDMIFKQSEKNHDELMEWVEERDERNNEVLPNEE